MRVTNLFCRSEKPVVYALTTVLHDTRCAFFFAELATLKSKPDSIDMIAIVTSSSSTVTPFVVIHDLHFHHPCFTPFRQINLATVLRESPLDRERFQLTVGNDH